MEDLHSWWVLNTLIVVESLVSVFLLVQDGRLKPGDQIMEVDGSDFVGYTQERLVMTL